MWSDSSLADVYRPTTCRAHRRSFIDPGQSLQPGAYSRDETLLTGLTVSLVRPQEPPALTSLSATYRLGGVCTHSETQRKRGDLTAESGWEQNLPKLNWPLISAAGKVAHPKHTDAQTHTFTRTHTNMLEAVMLSVWCAPKFAMWTIYTLLFLIYAPSICKEAHIWNE